MVPGGQPLEPVSVQQNSVYPSQQIEPQGQPWPWQLQTAAYAAVCNCQGQGCPCGSICCDGYTEFCCTLTGSNGCPPGTITAGWWKVDGSQFCGGAARYLSLIHI